MPEPHLRAADADRAAVATALGEHMAAGRLTVPEYEERLARAYAAKTYGELDALLTDLPGSTAPAVRAGSTAAAQDRRPAGWTAWSEADSWAWRSWASTAAIVVSIWAITSLATWELLYFWPIWVIGPWGVVLLIQTLAGGDDDEEPGPTSPPGR